MYWRFLNLLDLFEPSFSSPISSGMKAILRGIYLSLQVVLLLHNLNVVSAAVPYEPRSTSSLGSSPSKRDSDNGNQELDGIRNLVARRLPKHAQLFHFSFIEGSGDTFIISDSPDANGIAIECTTRSACARGLYTYENFFPRSI